mgnify:CR=1 FL=1
MSHAGNKRARGFTLVEVLVALAIVALAALGIMPIAVSAVLGVMVLIFTGCLRWQQASSALSTNQASTVMVCAIASGLASSPSMINAMESALRRLISFSPNRV